MYAMGKSPTMGRNADIPSFIKSFHSTSLAPQALMSSLNRSR
jgi:hypothetical protein